VSTFLKVALAMLLTLPLGAYITGTLVASQTDMPQERAPVVIDSRPTESPTATPTPPAPSRSPDDNGGDRKDRDDDRDDDSGHGGDDDVRVVRPTPRDVDDDLEDLTDDLADEREDRADDLADEREDRTDDSDDGDDGD
jgi:hypothetical protein